MGPEELKRKMEEGAQDASKIEAMTDRAGAILTVYQRATREFLKKPTDFDPNFDAATLALKVGWVQEKYYKGIMNTFLLASIEAVMTAEKFHLGQTILAYKKAGAQGKVKIEGVILPDLGKTSTDLEAKCACGHNFGTHTGDTEGYCMDLKCACQKFTLSEKKGKTK